MVTPAATLYTPEEYLALEREAEFKSEYLDGGIYAMSGGTPAHAQIAVSLASSLHVQLKKGPCRVFSSDLRVKTASSNMFTYPDVTVVCGELMYHDGHKDVVTNPVVIVEVLSDSTESYDRGKKFNNYRQIETLSDYILVSQKEASIDLYSRQHDGRWVISSAVGLPASIEIPSIACTLTLADVYDKIDFIDN